MCHSCLAASNPYNAFLFSSLDALALIYQTKTPHSLPSLLPFSNQAAKELGTSSSVAKKGSQLDDGAASNALFKKMTKKHQVWLPDISFYSSISFCCIVLY
jgi:hypothetical protein